MAYRLVPDWSETVAVSGGLATRSAAPTFEAEGFNLGGLVGVRIMLAAAVGQTISGGGDVRIWYFDPKSKLWMRSPLNDIPVTMPGNAPVGGAQRCWTSPDLDTGLIALPGSRLLAAPDGVAVSGGAGLLVSMCAALGGTAR